MNRVKVTITLQLEAKNPIHSGIAIAEVIKLLAPEQSSQIAKDLVRAVDVQLTGIIPPDAETIQEQLINLPDEPHDDEQEAK